MNRKSLTYPLVVLRTPSMLNFILYVALGMFTIQRAPGLNTVERDIILYLLLPRQYVGAIMLFAGLVSLAGLIRPSLIRHFNHTALTIYAAYCVLSVLAELHMQQSFEKSFVRIALLVMSLAYMWLWEKTHA